MAPQANSAKVFRRFDSSITQATLGWRHRRHDCRKAYSAAADVSPQPYSAASVILFNNVPVLNDADEIAAVLTGTVLQGYPVEETDSNIFAIGIGSQDVETAWRAARQAVGQTGRWPVATFEAELADVAQEELSRLDELAHQIDPWPYFPRWRSDFDMVLSRTEAANTLPGWLQADLSEQLAARLPETTTRSEINRMVYDLLVSQPHLAEPIHGYLDKLRGGRNWYVPGDGVDLVLLPTSSPWLAPAWLSYFGALDPAGVESLIAALWQWHRDHGAELVANWGTMLQFVLDRPPVPGDQAWTLARQIKAVGGSLRHSDWFLAFALPDCRHWFLHDRP